MHSDSIFALILVAAVALGAGCSSNPTEPSNAVNRPGIGSTFTFHDLHQDEQGTTLADSMSTYTIVQASGTYADRTDAFIALGAANDSVIFAYTPAGVTTYRPEIAIFGGISIPAGWLAVDTTTSGAQTIYDHKDTVAYGGTNLFFTTHLESQNLADTSVTVAGKAYNAFRWRTRTTVEAKVEFSGQVTTAVVEMVHSFSPEIGFFANNVTVAQSNSAASPVPNGTEQESLMSFVKR